MTGQRPDSFDALRNADPVHGAPAPSDSKARVWARVQEVAMQTPSPAEERRRNWVLGFGAAAIAVFMLAAFVRGPATSTPSQDPVGGNAAGGAAGGGAAGMCIAFSVEELARFDLVFDGTVTAVNGDQVTFSVNQSFIGDQGGSVTLTAPDYSQTSLEGGVELVAGERYLVSGEDGMVVGCGFTQPYSEAAAADYAAAAH